MVELKVTYRKADDLVPYAKNSRTHSERQVEQIAASITEFGFTQPILVDGDNGIIAGHGRLQAAKALGLAEVPVIELSGLSAAQKRAYVIADNKLTLNAGWNEALLSDELKSLGAEGFDLDLTGFDNLELVSFLTDGAAGEPDEGIDYKESYSIVVVCASEADQTEKYDALIGAGYECKVLVN